jgi:eukaryotic-like serine/threonine-protein kinase
MPDSSQCRQCGAPLPTDWPKGLCSRCALQGALELSSGPSEALPPEGSEAPSASGQPAAPGPLGTLKYFGDYELLEEIARGGMGIVYRARQKSLDRIVAVKMILAGQLATAADVQRFRAEAAAAAKLQHPNILGIYEVGEHDGRHYFSMEYVEGRNLAELVQEGPLPAARAAAYVKATAEAIHYAHQKGVLHRDVKPSNVLVDPFDQPRVMDFGLAKQVESASDLTLSGQVLGTPNFMPPEQAGGRRREVGVQSDVYGLGAVLFFLLTGRPPFLADSMEATLNAVLNADPVSPRLLNLNVPRDLETVCLKCLEKEPGKRYPTAEQLADELGCFLNGEPIQARPVGQTERLWRWCRRNPGLASTATAALLLFLIVGAGSPIAVLQINRARQQAEVRQKQAILEAAKSQQVAQFLKDMLKGVGPSQALGRDATLLREVLDKTAERLSHDLTNQPLVEAELRETIGRVYLELGDYSKAEAMQCRALELRQKLLGSNHLETARSLSRLSGILENLAKYAEGEKLAREALSIQTNALGTQHVEVACSLHSLGVQLAGQGRNAEAENLFRQALAMRRKLLGNEHRDVAMTLNNLADLRMGSDPAEAERILREAIAILQKLFGDAHPDLEVPLDNLAAVLSSQKKFDEAERTARATLAMKTNMLGPKHPHVARTLGILSWVLQTQGKFAVAEPLNREDFEIKKATVGYEHPETRMAFDGVLQVLNAQGKLTELEAFLREEASKLSQNAEVLKPGAAKLQSAMEAARIDVLGRQGRWAEVEQIYRERLQKQRQLSGPENLNLAGPIQQLADLCARQDKLAAAEGLARELIELRRKFWGRNHRETLNAQFFLGSLLKRQHKLAEAETLYREMAEAHPGARDHLYGRAGQLKEAAAGFARRIELEPHNPDNYSILAPLLLASGDLQGYRQLCQRMLAQFGGTTNANVAEQAVKACFLHPASGVDLDVVVTLADTAVAPGRPARYPLWCEFAKSLAEYRQEHFAGAADWARKVLGSAGQLLERDASAYLVLAMSQMRLQQEGAARVTLGKAGDIFDGKIPTLDGGDLGGRWADVIAAHVLRREAKALVEDNSSSAASDVKADDNKSTQPGAMTPKTAFK